MPGLVINNRLYDIPGLSIVNYMDDPRLRLKLNEDCRRRNTSWVRSIVLHTTKGMQEVVRPGLGPNTNLEYRIAKLWSTDGRNAGAHLSVDHDGTIACHEDVQLTAAYHAGEVNDVSIGIEIYEGNAQEVYEGQLSVVVGLINWLTEHFEIQRQMPLVTQTGLIKRMVLGGKDVVGVYGHRNVTSFRGPGDPGDAIFKVLASKKYEQFDFSQDVDKEIWKKRQIALGMKSSADGIPGPETVKALKRESGSGLWLNIRSNA